MESVIIIGLFGLFIGTIFPAVYFLPTILTKWRASFLGLSLTYRQARIVTKEFCNKKDFLLIVKDIWFWVEVPIGKLTNHYNAKGDLKTLRDGIIEMKQRNGEIDFWVLSTLDLAGQDLIQEINKAEAKNWVFDLSGD